MSAAVLIQLYQVFSTCKRSYCWPPTYASMRSFVAVACSLRAHQLSPPSSVAAADVALGQLGALSCRLGRMAPGHWVDTARDPDQWGQVDDHAGSFIEYGCGDEDGHPQGTAILCVTRRSPADEHGRAITATHIGASDAYYQWYADPRNRGRKGALGTDQYHLCRGAAEDCRASGLDQDAIHIDVSRSLEYEDVLSRLRKWRSQGTELPSVPENLIPPEDARRGEARPSETRGREPRRHEADAHKKHHQERSRGRRRRRDESSEASHSQRRSPSPRRQRSDRADRTGDEERALDKELRGLQAEGPSSSSGPTKASLQEKLLSLKRRLGGKEPAGKEASEKRDLQKVLLDRASAAEPKKKRRRKRKKDATRARSEERSREERDSSGGGLSDDEVFAQASRDLRAKRATFKRIAKEDPGRLLTLGLGQLREYLSTTFGETDEDELAPVCEKYLLTVFVPAYGMKKITDERFRELRTVAMSIDALLRGKTLEALDVLMQRFKAQALAIKDGNWRAARHLELLPADPGPSITTLDEEELARKVELGEMKVSELIHKLKSGSG